MTEAELKKKSKRSKHGQLSVASSKVNLRTLLKAAHSYGFLENATPKQPLSGFSLTTFDYTAIALGHAVLAMQCLERITSKRNPILLMPSTLQDISLNLREAICCLHDALNDSTNSKGLR